MYTFQVKQKDKSRILSVFHFLIALIFILDLSHIRHEGVKDWIFSGVYAGSCVFLIIMGLLQKKLLNNLSQHLSLLLFESAIILGGAIYFWSKGASLVAFSHGILAGVIILFWIYLKRREGGERIVISETNIILPGLSGERIVEWNELINVVKKYDLLTIDFKNNKLLQVEIINSDHINEDEFNQYCGQQLAEKNK